MVIPQNYTSVSDTDGANDNIITGTLSNNGNSTGNDFVDAPDSGIVSGTVLDEDGNPLAGEMMIPLMVH